MKRGRGRVVVPCLCSVAGIELPGTPAARSRLGRAPRRHFLAGSVFLPALPCLLPTTTLPRVPHPHSPCRPGTLSGTVMRRVFLSTNSLVFRTLLTQATRIQCQAEMRPLMVCCLTSRLPLTRLTVP